MAQLRRRPTEPKPDSSRPGILNEPAHGQALKVLPSLDLLREMNSVINTGINAFGVIGPKGKYYAEDFEEFHGVVVYRRLHMVEGASALTCLAPLFFHDWKPPDSAKHPIHRVKEKG